MINHSENSSQKSKKKSPKKARVITLCVICVLMLFFIISLIISNFSIKITTIEIENDKIRAPLRIAAISDLHTREHGKDNKRLFARIHEQNPDLILVAGDMLSSSKSEKENLSYLKKLTEALKDIAPVYFVIGNHDRDIPLLRSTIETAGGTLLDSEYTDIYISNTPVRLGGISYYRSWDEESNEFIASFSDVSEDVFTLLLCHYPELYLWGIEDYPIDLTVCGHTHGGMINLPILGPLFAPEQGWFPDYAKGLYSMKNGYLAITTGLASSPEYMPRVFNRPEIMIIELE